MKTLYLTDSGNNIIVDKDNDTVSKIEYQDRYSIRGLFYIEEPMHVVYEYGDRKEEIDVQPGNILIQFYSGKYTKYVLDCIDSDRWAANILQKREMEQQEKEEWAARNAGCPCCDECEKQSEV